MIGEAIRAVFRAPGNVCRFLVNMSRTQMKSVFSLAMVGGIIALSFQNAALIVLVYRLLGDATPGSLFGRMALNQQLWNNAIMAGFAIILGLVVFGADYFRAKYGDGEVGFGKGTGE